MAHDDPRWACLFPALFTISYVDYADCWTGFTTDTPPMR
jgi:hypothetical protein